jgi:hypothetical protein
MNTGSKLPYITKPASSGPLKNQTLFLLDHCGLSKAAELRDPMSIEVLCDWGEPRRQCR